MHSKIFQITETRVDKDYYLNENTLEQGDGHYYDYCSEIDEEERKFHIANLIGKSLPKGMFTLVGENTIRYNGGAVRTSGKRNLLQPSKKRHKPLPLKTA